MTGLEAAAQDSDLQESYDREAERYDAARYQSVDGRLFSELEVTLLREWLPLTGARILDVPAGTGRLSVELARLGARVVGMDISANMLGVAASKIRASGCRAHFTQGSGVHLPFADGSFNAVVSFKFFHLIPNERKRAFIAEMTRVLEPGGSLVVEFNSPFYGGILAAYRYYFRKRTPGGMRMKCIFPDQIAPLFRGLEIRRTFGVKLPLSGVMSRIAGKPMVQRVNRWFGRVPGLKYLAYAIVVEARKPVPR